MLIGTPSLLSGAKGSQGAGRPGPGAPLADQKVKAEQSADQKKAPEYEVVRTLASDRWERTDVISDRDPIFVQQNFHPRSRHRDPEVVAAFGTETPHSGDALLHYAGAPPTDAPPREAPVLLIHGANKNGHFWWDEKDNDGNPGLARTLKDQGHEVYALTFAHNQDDNFLQAEQVANALAEIKKRTGSEKVDLVAHSKGGVAARLYVSDVRAEGVESTPYQGDVRRLVLVGAPNGGIDYTFRHPSANYALMTSSDHPLLNAPPSWESAVYWGRNVNLSDQGYGKDGSDFYPGQRQILSNLSKQYPLSVFEPDFHTTYHGGQGFVSRSKGIDHYVEQGGNLIERMAQSPPPRDVEVALLAGDRANIPGIVNEYAGPSDGLVFVSSALRMPEEANVVAKEVLPLHHKALVSEPKGQAWIAQALQSESPLGESPAVQDALQREAEWAAEVPVYVAQGSEQAPHLLPMV